MGTSATLGRIWEEASSPEALALVQRFEAAWRSSRGRRPDPRDFLPFGPPGQDQGALLALLRAELNLRWEAGEKVRVESLRRRHPEIGAEALVALIYEEFCLREEGCEAPEVDEYERRFPEVASRLRCVLDIHDLVGGCPSTDEHVSAEPVMAFPEAGQTIAGFHLVEELGRGSFARVFLARERQLADRPVALKVARIGSREPQTLARLQHTHIVPVHSYRTDPVTNLHLLCMPYFGRITLAHLLADPEWRRLRSGADLIALLDRLDPAGSAPPGWLAGRAALAQRTFFEAIAWWGARLAEALQHAHDRGVLHRDVKPSNVLITADGLPMLLDFNLAGQPRLDPGDLEAEALGGTLAYMAPEHLLALATGEAGVLDARADLYALGVVLFEALGTRPFVPPSGALSATEALQQAAAQRRAGAPRLRDAFPEVPPALEAVVRKCLAPDPADRYRSASELAADLQAVADDGPLPFAREPQPSRTLRWLGRHRLLVLAAPALLALAVLGALRQAARLDQARGLGELCGEVEMQVAEAGRSLFSGDPDRARDQFEAAVRRASGQADPKLRLLALRASEGLQQAEQARAARARAEALFSQADALRFRLLGLAGDPRAALPWVRVALGPYRVLDDPHWAHGEAVMRLDPPRRARLLADVADLLFLAAVVSPEFGASEATGSWEQLSGGATAGDARACCRRARLLDREGRIAPAIASLERAIRLEPGHYWSHLYLGHLYRRTGRTAGALEHFGTAAALRPDGPWAYEARGQLHLLQRAWEAARDDLERALALAQGTELIETRLGLGIACQALGDIASARSAFETVIASASEGMPLRIARLRHAGLALGSGQYDQVIADVLAAADSQGDLEWPRQALLLLRLAGVSPL